MTKFAVRRLVIPQAPAPPSGAVPQGISPPGPRPPRLLDRVRIALRPRHYSARTEKAYVAWIPDE